MRVIISRISCMELLAILITIITVIIKSADATVGYDCRSKISSIRTISLLDIDECEIKNDEVETFHPTIALINLDNFKETDIIQCKVEIQRLITYCGMHSHNSTVNNGFMEYMYPTTREMCEEMHKSGTVKIRSVTINGLSVNKETREPVLLAGSVNAGGSCNGADYSDPFGSWSNVIVEATVKVNLKKETVKTKVNSDKIILPSRKECKLSDKNYIDSADGYTFWDALPHTNCSANTYSAFYKGKATKFMSENDTVISVDVKDTSFTLDIVGTQTSCGATIYKTKHPKLFIVEHQDFESLHRQNIINLKHDDSEIFQYTKFMYVERLRSQESLYKKSLYKNVKKYNCKLEREILKNMCDLSIAATQPDEFAFRYMQKPGFMAVMAGEAIHIVQCLPVVVKLRHSNKCYNRLPIESNNQSLFLTPLTHIITKYATELPCVTPLREQYNLEGTWIRLMPQPTTVPSPMILKPKSKMNFTFQNPIELERWELEEMRVRIMFPLEQNVIRDIIAQQLTGGTEEPVPIGNIFDEYIMQNLAESIWSRSWGKYIGFGTTCAGLIGIFVLLITILTIIDIFIWGYALYSRYGCSIHILAALWDPLAREMVLKE